MYNIRYATFDDVKALGEIHYKSWKSAYRGIVPNEILDNITPVKEKYILRRLYQKNGKRMPLYLKKMYLLD